MIDRRTVLAASLLAGTVRAQTLPPALAGAPVPAGDPTETIDLWPRGAPGAPQTLPVETVVERSTDPSLPDRSVSGIARPRMVVFRPARPNGSAVLVMPGGGYSRIVVDREGYELARWLTERGWTVFVLFYRLPGEGWTTGPDTALADAQRAMRMIRTRAVAYGIRPDRVAALGFSAGGHVCGDLSTRFAARTYTAIDAADRLDARPDLSAPVYAVQSMSLPLAHPGSRTMLIGEGAGPVLERAHTNALNVTARTPPTFLVHAEDDVTVDVGNTLQYRAALRAAGVPVETHLFAQGGHGFGLRRAAGKPAAIWTELFVAWARTHGLG